MSIKNKTYEEIHGVEKAILIKNKLRTCYKGTGRLGQHHTKEAKRKISIAKQGIKQSIETITKRNLSRKGYRHSEETKRKISKSGVGWKHSEEAKKKMREYPRKKLSNNHKEKIRNSTINYIEIKKLNGSVMKPNIGKNEEHILDAIENKLNIILKRQYRVCGFFVDGYDEINNIVYEIDEKRHSYDKIIKKDIERQKIITDKLKCKFIRIKDY